MPTITISRTKIRTERIQVSQTTATKFEVYNPAKKSLYEVNKLQYSYTCSCPWGTKRNLMHEGFCKHVVAVTDFLDHKKIPVGGGRYYAYVDREDYEYLKQFNWSPHYGTSHTVYAKRTVRHADGSQTSTYMHKEIFDVGPLMEVDHINRNGLDNRKYNLRECTKSQQKACTPFPPGETGFRGVRLRKSGRFNAHITVDRQYISLGTYKTAEEAAKVYDKAARKYYGEFATTNFV